MLGKRFCFKILHLIAVLTAAAAMTVQAAAWPQPDIDPVKAKGCVVIEKNTGRILYACSAHDRLPMASTTKIMTAMLTLEQPKLDEWFTVDSGAIHVEGSSMGLQEGDSVTLRALVYGMLLPSGNDAANAAAVRIAGSIPDFVQQMNLRAQEIGLENTHFVTVSGLDDDNHYSTAYDMAVLTAYAMQNPEFTRIASMSDARLEFGNPPYKRWLSNTNKLLERYDGCVGVKTGFTDAAYRCLVSAAERNNVTLICVTLNCADDWNIHSNLYDRYFAQLSAKDFTPHDDEMQVSVIGGNVLKVRAECMEKPVIPLKAGEAERIQQRLELSRLEFAPVSRGEYLGEYKLFMDGKEIFSTPIAAAEDAVSIMPPKAKNNILQRIKSLYKGFILR